VMDCRGPM